MTFYKVKTILRYSSLQEDVLNNERKEEEYEDIKIQKKGGDCDGNDEASNDIDYRNVLLLLLLPFK